MLHHVDDDRLLQFCEVGETVLLIHKPQTAPEPSLKETTPLSCVWEHLPNCIYPRGSFRKSTAMLENRLGSLLSQDYCFLEAGAVACMVCMYMALQGVDLSEVHGNTSFWKETDAAT